MRPFINVIGILLIIFGILTLGYQGITYTKREKIAQIGDLQVTANQEKTIYFPPIVGVLCLVGGIVIIVVNRLKK